MDKVAICSSVKFYDKKQEMSLFFNLTQLYLTSNLSLMNIFFLLKGALYGDTPHYVKSLFIVLLKLS